MVFNPVKKLVNWLKNIWATEDTDGLLYLNDDHIYKIKDEEEISKAELEDLDEETKEKVESFNAIDRVQINRQNRYAGYENKHPKSIMRRARDNPYVFQDIISDPGTVDCETPGEVVETMADNHPGWAKMVDTAEIAPEADVETGTESGEATDLEANSDVGIGSEVGSTGDTTSGDFGSDTAGVASGSIDTDAGSMNIQTGSSSANSGGGANSGGANQ